MRLRDRERLREQRRRDSQGSMDFTKKIDCMGNTLAPALSFRGFVGQNFNVFIIAMDDSDWAIHDSNLAARWHKLADFD